MTSADWKEHGGKEMISFIVSDHVLRKNFITHSLNAANAVVKREFIIATQCGHKFFLLEQ